MIYVRVELWPRGNQKAARVLGEGFIANTADSEDRENVGNYRVRLMKSPEYSSGKGVWKEGRVLGFPRLRLGPWDLLLRALQATVGKRNREQPTEPLTLGEDSAGPPLKW